MNCLICLGIGWVCENHPHKTRAICLCCSHHALGVTRLSLDALFRSGRALCAREQHGFAKVCVPCWPSPWGRDNAVSSVLLDDKAHVFASEVIVAENDEEAMLRAIRLRDRYDIEVWQLDRKVALIKAPK